MMMLMSVTEKALVEDYSATLVNCVQKYLLTATPDIKKFVQEILTMAGPIMLLVFTTALN